MREEQEKGQHMFTLAAGLPWDFLDSTSNDPCLLQSIGETQDRR